MAIIKEYRCLDCEALFESSDADPACPQCTADEPERVFLTPPSIKSPKTAFQDATVKQLAADFGMSDMSNRHGKAVKEGPASPPAQFSGDAMAQLARIPQNARDGFSPLMGAFKSPNAGLAAQNFPFAHRARLKPQ